MELDRTVGKLIGYARVRLGLDARNVNFVRNTVLDLIGMQSYQECGVYEGEKLSVLLEELVKGGVEAGLFPLEEAENKKDAVMGALALSPKEVEEIFYSRMSTSSARAAEWLYDYAVSSDYVKKEALDKNPRFTAENGLIVTINLSKPEFRDPKKAASGNSVKGGYPACTICRENEGFFGRAKRTLRTVSLKLGGEDWFWQFSPYGYFYQHGIAVNCRHTPMKVDRSTYCKLMDFVDLFPHWFIGCNAPLPRIGGSVLAHDHFQGGGEILPIFRAGTAVAMHGAAYPAVSVEILDWKGTAVRLVSRSREEIANCADRIARAWEKYEDRARYIIPFDADGAHNAVSPTVRKTADGYSLTLILRSNSTSEEFPDGVYHAHPEFHVIKKESIGLIEAQGLFILPGRLVSELGALKKAMVAGASLPEGMEAYRMIFEEMGGGNKFTEAAAREAIARELGSVCERILGNTAVFATHADTAKFLRSIGFEDGKVSL